MAEVKRRYYFANTLQAVIATLGIPEHAQPCRSANFLSKEHIAWMTMKVARMDVRNLEDAREVDSWVRRIYQSMEAAGYWDRAHSDALRTLDTELGLHLPHIDNH